MFAQSDVSVCDIVLSQAVESYETILQAQGRNSSSGKFDLKDLFPMVILAL